jgi:trimeric autotransporter adhesin
MKELTLLLIFILSLFLANSSAFGKDTKVPLSDFDDKRQPFEAIKDRAKAKKSFSQETSAPEMNFVKPSGTEGDTNTFYGLYAGDSITTGCCNTFIGCYAGASTETGEWNTFLGRHAGYSATTSNGNVFVGLEAGFGNTTGPRNTFVGIYAGTHNDVGERNVFVGASAGKDATSSNNVFVGIETGSSNTTGEGNTFVGPMVGYKNTIGTSNTFVGHHAGFNNIEGHRNVFIGEAAGKYETGSYKLYIDNTGTTTPLIFGDFNTNNVVIYGGFRSIASYSSSDRRWKKNIEPLKSSLEKISNLQGVRYEWKTDKYPDVGMTEGDQIGLVAQDVESVIPELVSEDRDGYKAVSYNKLTAVLVEAVKELKTQSERQQTEIERLRALIKDLKD